MTIMTATQCEYMREQIRDVKQQNLGKRLHLRAPTIEFNYEYSLDTIEQEGGTEGSEKDCRDNHEVYLL
jgi:hypothetical protein